MTLLVLITSLALGADDFKDWQKLVRRSTKEYVQAHRAIARLDAKLLELEQKQRGRVDERQLKKFESLRTQLRESLTLALSKLRAALASESNVPEARLRFPFLRELRSDVASVGELLTLVQGALSTAALDFCAGAAEADVLEVVDELLSSRGRFVDDDFSLLKTLLGSCEYAQLSDGFLDHCLAYAERYSFAKLGNARLGRFFYGESLRVLFSRDSKAVFETLDARMRRGWSEFQPLTIKHLFLAEAAQRVADQGAPAGRGAFDKLLVDLLSAELRWYRDRREPKGRGKAYLAPASYRASVYMLMDAYEKLYRGGPPDRESVRLISGFLDVSEPQVVKLGTTSVRKVTLTRRLCGKTLRLLRRWTGFQHLTWFEEWEATLGQEEVKLDPHDQDGRSKVRESSKRPSFYGIQTDGGRVAFVLDFSGSMKREGMDFSLSLKKEAANFFRDARRGTLLNLVPYSTFASVSRTLTGAKSLYEKRQEVGKLDEKITRYLGSLKPHGVTSVQDGFRVAFSLNPVRDGVGLDDIVFVSDGMPTNRKGKLIAGAHYHDLLAYIIGVARLNAIRVHTVGFPGAQEALLREISSSTGGQHRMVR